MRRNLRLMKRLSFIDVANASCAAKTGSFKVAGVFTGSMVPYGPL